MHIELRDKSKSKVQAKILKIHGKTADCCCATLVSADGEILKEQDGYVPEFMPGDHYGDYLILDIDIDTGTILNWTAPTAAQLQSWIEAERP